jgi:Bacterial membrane protein YfhO
MKRDLLDRRPVILLVVIIILFFWKLVFSNQFTFLESPDLAYQVLPWYQVQARAWNAGIFPMWDPYQWTGQPLLGQMQPGAAFPLNWPLFRAPLRDGHIHFRYIYWHYVFMHVLAGLFMYAFVRELGRSRYASLIAAVAFACAGYIGSIAWPQMLHGAIWIPLIFLLFHRMATAHTGLETMVYAGLCGGAIGMSLLSGHHQTPLFTLLALTGFFLYHLYERKQRSTRAAVRFAGSYTLVAVFAFFVAALQLLPAIEYGSAAVRWVSAPDPVSAQDNVPYYVQDESRLSPVTLLGAVVPHSYFQVSTFVGLLCLSMAVYALATCWQQRWVRVYACLGLGALVYSLGPYSILHGWIYAFVPYMDKARSASHAVFILQFSVFVLAAYGIDHFFSAARGDFDARRWTGYIVRALLVFGLLGCIFLFGQLVDGQMHKLPGDEIMVACLAAFVLAALLHSWRSGLMEARSVRYGFLMLMVFEMSTTNWWDIPHREEPTRQRFLAALSEYHDVMKYLKSQPRPFRFEIIREGQIVNVGGWEGVEQVDGYLASLTEDIYEFVLQDWGARRLLLNTVYTIAKQQQRPEQIEVYQDRNGWKVFQNPDASPRAWIVHDLAGIGPSKDRFAAQPPTPDSCEGDERVTFDDLGLQSTRATARLACAGYAVFADPYLPGWQAEMDGKRVPVYITMGLLRTVAVPAGEHAIEFSYRPRSVYWGAWLTGIGFLACGMLGIFGWRRGLLGRSERK